MHAPMKTHSIQISSELIRLFSDIDEFKGAWRALGSLAPDRLRALRHVATIESVGSSTRIEGSKLSDREVEKLLLAIDVQQPDSRDEQEVAGYAQTIEMIFQAYADMPITENHIKQLHRDLLRHSQKDERHRGEYKKIANPVAAFNNSGQMVGVLLETASPFDTPRRMTELIHWFNEENELARLHPLIRIAVFIVAFLQIHPFQDGNGRLSRLLTTLLLLRAGYVYVPYCSLEHVIEERRDLYYLALRETQQTLQDPNPNWQPWLLFFARALQEQKSRLAIKVEEERVTTARLSELATAILAFVRDYGRVTPRDMVALGANPNTVKVTFSKLVEKGLLQRLGAGRSTWYKFPQA